MKKVRKNDMTERVDKKQESIKGIRNAVMDVCVEEK